MCSTLKFWGVIVIISLLFFMAFSIGIFLADRYVIKPRPAHTVVRVLG